MGIAAKFIVLGMLSMGHAAAPTGATFVKGGTICGACEKSATMPPTTYICDCGATGTTCDTSYIKQSVLSLSFCITQTWHNTTCTVVDQEVAGTRKSQQSDSLSAGAGNTYAGMTDGIGVGTVNSGGYIGTASYLALAGELKYNSNDFLISTSAGVSQIASICVVPAADTTATSFTQCGAPRKATPGTYKFSLYGYTWGNNYSVPTGKNIMVGRTKVCAVGGTAVKVNGVADGTGIVGFGTQVTSVSATQHNGVELTYAFPQAYMWGKTTDCTTNGTLYGLPRLSCTPSGTRSVYITAAAADCGAGATGIFVDYGFDVRDLNVKDRWFAYDPAISSVPAPVPAPAPAGGNATGNATTATTAAPDATGPIVPPGQSSDVQPSAAASAGLLALLFAAIARP